MGEHRWSVSCTRPQVVMPVRRDLSGVSGPTRGQARGANWRQVAAGWYVPAETDSYVVEQRILEAGVRLPPGGAVTGWASLRWQGARFFDGLEQGGTTRLPVPMLLGTGNLRPDPRVVLSKEQLPPAELTVVADLPVSTPDRAVFDELRWDRRLRRAVVAVDMALAAHLTSLASMRRYALSRAAWTGIPFARKVLLYASEDSRSPQETRMRLVWVIDAGLPPPVCNQPVFDRGGRLLGVPDLFEPVAGLVGEYDGADHTVQDRRRSDAAREERFRDHGLEYFELVRGDLASPAVCAARMYSARARARFLPPEQRQWTLAQPDWWKRRTE